jgi:hypothetical protein
MRGEDFEALMFEKKDLDESFLCLGDDGESGSGWNGTIGVGKSESWASSPFISSLEFEPDNEGEQGVRGLSCWAAPISL